MVVTIIFNYTANVLNIECIYMYILVLLITWLLNLTKYAQYVTTLLHHR